LLSLLTWTWQVLVAVLGVVLELLKTQAVLAFVVDVVVRVVLLVVVKVVVV